MTPSLRHKAAVPDAPKAKVAAVRKLSVNGSVSPAPPGSARAASRSARRAVSIPLEDAVKSSFFGNGALFNNAGRH
jgi:hypothetical protein